jgi:hypothetical protein
MPILTSEIKWFRSAMQSDSTPAANGGRMALTEIVSGVKNNLFPDVSQAQRASGITHWRKAFIAVRNAAGIPLMDPKVSIELGTPGDSYVLLYPGTQTDTEDEVAARPYGYGTVAASALAAATTLVVTTEADFSEMAAKPFQVGDLIRIDARATVEATGNVEYRRIDAIVYDDDEITLTLTSGLEFAWSVGAKVASVIEPDDVVASVGAVVPTGGVTFTAAGNLDVNNLGAIQQTWTVTVTDAATGALSVAGDTLGVVGAGALGATLAPNNPTGGGAYFTLRAAGWGGTPADGDTIVFTTVPAAIPLWYQRVVPAGSAAISSDPVSVCIEGESS